MCDGGGGMFGRGHVWQERRPLHRMVRILLEPILVIENKNIEHFHTIVLTFVLWYIGAIIEMYLSMLRAIKLYELENRKLQSGIFIDMSLHSNWSENGEDILVKNRIEQHIY